MNTQDITGQIREVVKAIDNLSIAQSYPMTYKIRCELGREINCLYGIIEQMSQEYRSERD